MSKKDTQNKINRLNKRLLEEIDLSEDRRQIIEALTNENRILDAELHKSNAELEKYRIKDTYELAKFIEKEARKIAINKLEKIKKFNSQQVLSSKPIEDFINEQIKECLEGQMENKSRFEKGVGVSIETFIKIITDGFYYKEGKNIYWESNAVFIGNGYCPHSNSMVKTHFLHGEYNYESKKSITDQHYWDWAKKEDVFNFEDYGKTWSANREDLVEED